MNHLKDHVKAATKCMHFLTYADNYAIGYFKKQVRPIRPIQDSSLTIARRDSRRTSVSTAAYGLGTSKTTREGRSCTCVIAAPPSVAFLIQVLAVLDAGARHVPRE